MTRSFGIVAAALAAAAFGHGAAAQSASSNPFAGLGAIFNPRGQPVTTEEGVVLGPPVRYDVLVIDGDDDLAEPITRASLINGALAEDRATGQDLLAAARGDYARVLGVLFDEGYFSAIVNITLDGREAAEIAPLDAPDYVGQVVIAVDPGPQFRFARADLSPLAPGTAPLDAYAVGEIASTGVIKSATAQAIRDWRSHGAPKARVAADEIIADHNVSRLESWVQLEPGPVATFGRLQYTGNVRLSDRRLEKIAGFPSGERFDPAQLDTVRKRLRRAGVFSAITLVEAETLNPDNSLDVGLTVVEQKLRRVGAAFEVSNVDGALISAYWLHRNLLGGAERLRVEGRVSDIGTDADGLDYQLDVRIDRPATLTPDTTAYVETRLSEDNEPERREQQAEFALGFNHIFSDRLTADLALKYTFARVDYGAGFEEFSTVSLPASVTWDRRDDPTDAKRGQWLFGSATPFVGLRDTGSGAQVVGEGRAYRSFLDEDRLTLAGRLRLGTVIGPDIAETPPEYLFYSGGGGTVRGQPFESLGVRRTVGPEDESRLTGGMSIATASAELRFQVRQNIGAVAFVDGGEVWDDSLWQGESGWHAGAGVGLRYNTPIGPLRFDVATPINGEDDVSRVQLYLGLGQAF